MLAEKSVVKPIVKVVEENFTRMPTDKPMINNKSIFEEKTVIEPLVDDIEENISSIIPKEIEEVKKVEVAKK